MATYYHVGSEIQGEGLQTLYLMNPGYMGYSEAAASPAGTNMVLMNSGGNSLNPGGLGHAQQQNQHLVGIPLQSTASTPVLPPSQNPSVHGFVPRHYYNYWTSPSADPAAGGASHHPIQSMPQMESELGVRRGHPVQQGLSLSLSPQRPAYPTYRPEPEIPSSSGAISPGCGGEDARISSNSWSNSAVSTGINGIHSVLMGSKYLKAAQQVLDEVVNVGKGIKDGKLKNSKGNKEQSMENSGGELNGKRSAELTTAERQELQMKKAKLVNMLDEVEQRYRQYHHQMQIIVSTFEAAAGLGSARTYTALALQTISKQFRCLRDAISGQIRAASRSLGEDESLGGSSRLKLVDHQMRQQRALQQLGMIQHNAWRPQRGLPERSVSVLRAWLFEHFLHPYPKDSDKIMLAKQTGLTRNQVSNWFINARVRLWKPMVEEMYMQETKEQEQNGAHDKSSKIETNEDSASKSAATQENSPIRMEQINNLNSIPEMTNEPKAPPLPSAITSSPSLSPAATLGTALRNHSSFRLVGSSDSQASFHEEEQMLQVNPKKPKYQNANTIPLMSSVDMKHNETDQQELFFEQQTRNGYSLLRDTTTGGGFGGYQIGDMARFNLEQFAPRFTGNNGVSLTLGLPDCDNLSLSGTQQTYLSNQNFQMGRRLEMGGEANDFCNMNSPSATHSSNAYDSLNIQERKQYAAQLLPDFVA